MRISITYLVVTLVLFYIMWQWLIVHVTSDSGWQMKMLKLDHSPD